MSMITNVYYEPTLLGALGNTYPDGSYVRTLGFAEAGDGGAAMYEVVSVSGSPISYPDVSLYCEDGRFSKTAFTCFKLIPQNGKVYAEQFGVLPGDTTYSANNSAMLRRAVAYSASNGYRLEFASKSTYYFSGSGVDLKSNLFIDGNGAIFEICGTGGAVTFFDTIDEDDNVYIAHNVTLRNFTCVGRSGDQFLYGNLDGFVMQNVTVKNFGYGLRTRTRLIAENYVQPEIVNKNWLVEDCVINVATSFQMSEIDGITVKDSVLTSFYPTSFPVDTYGNHSYYDASKYVEAHIYDDLGGTHNIYMSSNCMNVRLSNLIMGNVTGDAVHKAYAVTKEKAKIRFDKSKNHFYTDLSINKCNAPLNIGFISENVMCDNVFGTDLRYLVHLSAASNCIVANSSLTVERKTFERPNAQNPKQIDTVNPNLGLYVHSACSCWFQNSYLKTNGRQRTCAYETEDAFYHTMSIKDEESTDDNFVDKRHMRTFIGAGFDIPNHWFKFTGCELESIFGGTDYYFYEVTNKHFASPAKAQFGEFLDNCSYSYNATSENYRIMAINDLFGGITYRNCYMKNLAKTGTIVQPPFGHYCNLQASSGDLEDYFCKYNPNVVCSLLKAYKKYPWLHFENNIYDNFSIYHSSNSWQYYFKSFKDGAAQNRLTHSQVANLIGAYSSNCFNFINNTFEEINDLSSS